MGKWEIPPKGGHMDLADGIYFQNMTTKEVEERLKKCDLLLLPIGSTENHGPHACYGEDTFLVTRIAETIAKKTGCTVSQPLWYGIILSTTLACRERFRLRRTFSRPISLK